MFGPRAVIPLASPGRCDKVLRPRRDAACQRAKETGVIRPDRAFDLRRQGRPCRRAAFTVDRRFHQQWPFTPSAAPPPSTAAEEWRVFSISGFCIYPVDLEAAGSGAAAFTHSSFFLWEANNLLLMRLLAPTLPLAAEN